MSSIYWSDNRLIQRVGGHEEELGNIAFEQSSKSYVLWLKDTFGVTNTAGAYIRADEYSSMDVAKSKALTAPSVSIWHLVWMRGVVKREAEQEIDNNWEEFSANADTVPIKEILRDRLRSHLDRLPVAKIKELFKKVGRELFTLAIVEIVKRLLNG